MLRINFEIHTPQAPTQLVAGSDKQQSENFSISNSNMISASNKRHKKSQIRRKEYKINVKHEENKKPYPSTNFIKTKGKVRILIQFDNNINFDSVYKGWDEQNTNKAT